MHPCEDRARYEALVVIVPALAGSSYDDGLYRAEDLGGRVVNNFIKRQADHRGTLQDRH